MAKWLVCKVCNSKYNADCRKYIYRHYKAAERKGVDCPLKPKKGPPKAKFSSERRRQEHVRRLSRESSTRHRANCAGAICATPDVTVASPGAYFKKSAIPIHVWVRQFRPRDMFLCPLDQLLHDRTYHLERSANIDTYRLVVDNQICCPIALFIYYYSIRIFVPGLYGEFES